MIDSRFVEDLTHKALDEGTLAGWYITSTDDGVMFEVTFKLTTEQAKMLHVIEEKHEDVPF